MITLLIATRNTHKTKEIQAILGERFCCLTLNDFPGAPEIVEDAGTFAGNATKKAVALAAWLAGARNEAAIREGQLLVLADDSGLEVDALDGAPGVLSARFAALDAGTPGNSPTTDNNNKLLRLLKDVPPEKRTARFRCIVALTPVTTPESKGTMATCSADALQAQSELFEGTCEGTIVASLRGKGGFGYDPLFVPQGYEQTFGELPETTKNQLSHRAKALASLKQRLSPDNEKVGVGRDLAEALAKTELSDDEAKAWRRDLQAARKTLKVSRTNGDDFPQVQESTTIEPKYIGKKLLATR